MQMLRKGKAMRVAALLLMVILVVAMMAPALAAEDSAAVLVGDTGIASDVLHTVTPKPTPTPTEGSDNKWYHQWGLDKPENQVTFNPVSTDEVNNWVERKGNDVISIMQTAGKVLAIIGFFACIIICIIGAMSNRRLLTGGLIGMLIAASAYVALTQGKELINLFSAWVMS